MARATSKTKTAFHRFGKSETGTIMLIGAMMLPMLLGAAGASVDFSRAIAARATAQSVLDQTLLSLSANAVKNSEIANEGETIFETGLHARDNSIGVLSADFTGEGEADARPNMIDGSANLRVDTFFLGLIGINELDVNVSASVVPPRSRPVEVSLVLDVSGSMDKDFGDGTRLEVLKSAVNEMFDILDERVVPFAPLSVSVVPYSSSVNIGNVPGTAIAAQSVHGATVPAAGSDIWAGERIINNSADDAQFTLSDASPLVESVPFYSELDGLSANRSIPSSRLLSLTGDDATYRSAVEGLVPDGWTAAHIGMIWGVYSLSPNWASVWDEAPEAYGEAEKIIVMLTDGAFNTTVAIGDQSTSDGATSNSYFQAACDLAHGNEITVYTIALSLDAANAQRLADCVEGGAGKAIGADSASELTNAFKDIANLIGKLRLSS